MIKKNVPYKVLKGLWIALMPLLILNIIGLWLWWNGKAIPLGIVSGVLVLLDLIAMAVVSFLNINTDIRVHGFAYGLLAVLHLVFVLLIGLLNQDGENLNNSCPALFTVFIVVIALVAVFFALRGKHPLAAFGAKKGGQETPIRREDLGVAPTEDKANEVANPENNPDRKPGRDEKTGIVSL